MMDGLLRPPGRASATVDRMRSDDRNPNEEEADDAMQVV
jgi:hypothetical protein